MPAAPLRYAIMIRFFISASSTQLIRGRPSPHHHPLEAQGELVHFWTSCGIQASTFTQPSVSWKETLIACETDRSLFVWHHAGWVMWGHLSRPHSRARAGFTSRAVWLFRSLHGWITSGDATGIPSSVLYATGWSVRILSCLTGKVFHFPQEKYGTIDITESDITEKGNCYNGIRYNGSCYNMKPENAITEWVMVESDITGKWKLI